MEVKRKYFKKFSRKRQARKKDDSARGAKSKRCPAARCVPVVVGAVEVNDAEIFGIS